MSSWIPAITVITVSLKRASQAPTLMKLLVHVTWDAVEITALLLDNDTDVTHGKWALKVKLSS